jgi:hypothetical protein
MIGKVIETDTFKLAADGETLTDDAKQMKADGGAIESTAITSAIRVARRSLGNGR